MVLGVGAEVMRFSELVVDITGETLAAATLLVDLLTVDLGDPLMPVKRPIFLLGVELRPGIPDLLLAYGCQPLAFALLLLPIVIGAE